MQLDSVRELKAALAEQILAPAVEAVRSRSLPGGARALALASATPPSLALGVARRGRREFALAVRLQSRALESGRELERIRKQARGEVDVRYVGRVSKRAAPWHRVRQRPLLIGGSVGHAKVTAGTIGAFVRPRGGGSLAILSNNHVLANESRARKGDPILQPGAYDGGGSPGDEVGEFLDAVRLRKLGANTVDAAVASLRDGLEADLRKLTGLGRLAGVGDVFLDEGTEVAKVGRTTGLTRGRVSAFELDNVTVAFDVGVLRFDNQIEIEGAEDGPFSEGGDSGSLIVGADLRAVGLLFAGSDQGGAKGQGLTFANPLAAVLEGLKVELALE